jgi:hypothetical protein
MKQDAYDTFVTIAFFLWILTPLGILGWQIYGYLRYAVWNSLSVIDSLRWLGSEWASNPTDWTGLYSVLEWTPLSVGVLILGIFLYLIAQVQD